LARGKRVIVIGVGNTMLSDEGLGVKAIEMLEKTGLPKDVRLYDAGVSLQRALSLVQGFDKMVIIDAIKAGKKPGSIYRFTLEELERDKKEKVKIMLSLHDLDVPAVIALEKLVVELPPEIVFIGMEPASINPGANLSPVIEAKMKYFISAIRRELRGAK
jgi:hydrogenase maturation protease